MKYADLVTTFLKFKRENPIPPMDAMKMEPGTYRRFVDELFTEFVDAPPVRPLDKGAG